MPPQSLRLPGRDVSSFAVHLQWSRGHFSIWDNFFTSLLISLYFLLVRWRTQFGEETALWTSNTPFFFFFFYDFFVTRSDVVYSSLDLTFYFTSHVHIWFCGWCSRGLFRLPLSYLLGWPGREYHEAPFTQRQLKPIFFFSQTSFLHLWSRYMYILCSEDHVDPTFLRAISRGLRARLMPVRPRVCRIGQPVV